MVKMSKNAIKFHFFYCQNLVKLIIITIFAPDKCVKIGSGTSDICGKSEVTLRIFTENREFKL